MQTSKAVPCSNPQGCGNTTTDPTGRCHLHRNGDGAAAGKASGALAGSTGNMIAEQNARQKGQPTFKLTPDEKEFYGNMQVGASFRAPYFRRSIAKFKVASYPGLGTFAMGKNGIVYIDFDWAREGGIEKASAILIHEASHFNLDHFNRGDNISKDRKHDKIKNLAGDMEINQGLVKRDHGSKTPNWRQSILQEEYNAVYPWSKGFEFDPDQPFEVYLRLLAKKQEEQQQQQQQQGGGDQQQDSDGSGDDQQDGGDGDGGDGDGDGESGGMGGPDASPDGQKKGKGGGKGGQEGESGTMCGGGSAIGEAIDGEMLGDDAGMNESEIENLRRDTARDILDHEKQKGRGTVPGNIVRMAEELLAGTKIDWRRDMRAAVSNSVRAVRGRKRYNTKMHNRRMANASRYIFPGTETPTPNISVAVDTSGSMGREELGLALDQIRSILNQAGSKSRVDFISVDADATEPKELKKLSDISLSGGGGTDMGVAIKSFDERRKNRPDLGIIVTDGGTPWPSEKPKDMDIVIAIVGQGASESEYRGPKTPDWAKTVYISQIA